VSNGSAHTSTGAFSGIAYLQTGACLFNGEGCALLETTLIDPGCPGCGSSTDISLIAPHVLNVPVRACSPRVASHALTMGAQIAFAYTSGTCAGRGTACTTPACTSAFFVPTDNQVQVQCEDTDADLEITFCPGAAASASSASVSSASTTPAPASSTLATVTVYKTVTASDCGGRGHPRDFLSN
jgi:hypothetical protein